MNTKNVTVRIPEELYQELSVGEDSINFQIVHRLEKLSKLERLSLQELKGKFASSEWAAIADSLNGIYTKDETFRYNSEALAAHLEDSDLYERIGERWKVDIKKLCRKVRSLSSTQVDAIYRRVETFWEHSTTTGLDTWAKF